MTVSSRTTLLPDNLSDAKVVANTRPPHWRNPVPKSRYDLVVIGGGTAGRVSAGGAALAGAKVALVERDLAATAL